MAALKNAPPLELPPKRPERPKGYFLAQRY
jgi:hypothetical protein